MTESLTGLPHESQGEGFTQQLEIFSQSPESRHGTDAGQRMNVSEFQSRLLRISELTAKVEHSFSAAAKHDHYRIRLFAEPLQIPLTKLKELLQKARSSDAFSASVVENTLLSDPQLQSSLLDIEATLRSLQDLEVNYIPHKSWVRDKVNYSLEVLHAATLELERLVILIRGN